LLARDSQETTSSTKNLETTKNSALLILQRLKHPFLPPLITPSYFPKLCYFTPTPPCLHSNARNSKVLVANTRLLDRSMTLIFTQIKSWLQESSRGVYIGAGSRSWSLAGSSRLARLEPLSPGLPLPCSTGTVYSSPAVTVHPPSPAPA
jgi:hypothetical protein